MLQTTITNILLPSLLGVSLITQSVTFPGPGWSRQRDLVAPALSGKQPAAVAEYVDDRPNELEKLRTEGASALYNLDYATARDRYKRMTEIAPDRPAGFLYLASNLWLQTLNQSRRLSTSLYSGESFYVQSAEADKTDPVRDKEFAGLIKKALVVAEAIVQKDPNNTEGIYYQAAALGLRASYSATVGRSFRRAIGDANESIQLQRKVIKLDPTYYDAYLSIGLYEYVIDSLPFVWRVLARLAGLKGSKATGIQHLETVTKLGKYSSDDARVLLIGLYAREHKLDKALEIIGYLADKYPHNYLFGVERASMFYRLGKNSEGALAFEELLKKHDVTDSATDLVNYQWGEALATAGDQPGALEKFKAVIEWKQSSPALATLAHLKAGEALDALGKRQEALAEYKEVLRRDNVFDSLDRARQHVRKPA